MRIAVVGAGGVGGFGVQISAALGAHVVAIDVSDDRLTEMAAHSAALTLNSAQAATKSIRKAIRAFCDEHHVPSWRLRIFESSGHPAGQGVAFGVLGPRAGPSGGFGLLGHGPVLLVGG